LGASVIAVDDDTAARRKDVAVRDACGIVRSCGGSISRHLVVLALVRSKECGDYLSARSVEGDRTG